MAARMYGMTISHPSRAAAAMIAWKRIPHRMVWLLPGLHPTLVRLAGFERHTVPALELDGHKVQGSRAIARFLESVRPDPPFFPRDPEARARVEEAERWGEQVLQPVPRRLFRYLLLTRQDVRVWMGSDVMGLPAVPALIPLFRPVLGRLAWISRASDEKVRTTVEGLPDLLDQVDGLIAEGVIGGPQPNAADFQILSAVRVLLEFEDFAELVAARPSAAPARRLFPSWPGPIPRGLS
jgi:glutathione S-transferase